MNQKYIDKETNEQNFQKALINNDTDGMWQAVFLLAKISANLFMPKED